MAFKCLFVRRDFCLAIAQIGGVPQRRGDLLKRSHLQAGFQPETVGVLVASLAKTHFDDYAVWSDSQLQEAPPVVSNSRKALLWACSFTPRLGELIKDHRGAETAEGRALART